MKFESARSAPAPFSLDAGLEPTLVLGVILALAAIILGVRISRTRRSRRSGKSRAPRGFVPGSIFAKLPQRPPAATNMSDPADQMKAIALVAFDRVRLLNKDEARLLPVLEDVAARIGQGHRVMAQTSLGEIIAPRKGSGSEEELRRAHASINSKRLDFAIFDRSGLMVCAIEYQGTGHYQGTAFMRDAVKREALRRAGVPFVEISARFDANEVAATLTRVLRPDSSGSQHGHTAVHV